MPSHATAAASAPTAAPMTSALCQPNASLAKPATTEPSICPEMIASSMRPIITWRSLMSKLSPRPARTSGIRPPAKMPAPTRVAIRSAKLGANAPTRSIAARPATHTWMQRGLPKRSPIGPRNGCASAYGSA